MSDTTKDELITIVIRALPYGNQVQNFDTLSEPNAVRFTWRGNRFRVTTDLFTEEVQDSFLVGNDLALLAETLFKKEYIALLDKKTAVRA